MFPVFPETGIQEVLSRGVPEPKVPEVVFPVFPKTGMPEVLSRGVPEPKVLEVVFPVFPKTEMPEVPERLSRLVLSHGTPGILSLFVVEQREV
ncbi:MAG: hypothetical protein STSR0009_15770 [Methanoregula sp.]